MNKQLLTITDFSGNMNLEDDPSNLGLTEATELVNLVPYGQGWLKLDRGRTELKSLYMLSTSITDCYGTKIWRDGAGNIVIPFILRGAGADVNKIYCIPLYHNSSLGTGSPSTISSNSVNTVTSVFRASRNSLYAFGGVLRFCNSGAAMAYITNFTDRNGTGRSRFASAQTLSGLKMYCPAWGGTDMHDGSTYAPTISIIDSACKNKNGSAKTYIDNEVGFYLTEASGGSYSSGDKVNYGVSFELDYIQETPMAGPALETTMFTVGSDNYYVSVTLAAPTDFNDRVTAINLYRSINGGEYYFYRRIDIEKGVEGDSGSYSTWTAVSGVGWKVTFYDYGYDRTETYLARTGYTDYQRWSFNSTTGIGTQVTVDPFTVMFGDIGCMFRNYALVNTNSYMKGNNLFYPEKRIAVSKPNMADMFDPDHYLEFGTENSSRFTGIAPLGMDRWVAWDPTHTYVINAASNTPLGWYIENIYNVGIPTGNAWCETSFGLAFLNQNGIYLLDYNGSISEPSRRIRSDFKLLSPSKASLYFSGKDNILYAINTGRTGGNKGYQFDFERKSWCWWDVGAYEDYIMGIGEGYDPDETYAIEMCTTLSYMQVHTIEAHTASLDVKYKSPHFDMGDYSVYKKGKHLFVKYKASKTVTVIVYLDGSTTATLTDTSTFTASATTVTEKKIDIPYRFHSIQVEVQVANTTGLFELHEISIEYKTNRPK